MYSPDFADACIAGQGVTPLFPFKGGSGPVAPWVVLASCLTS